MQDSTPLQDSTNRVAVIRLADPGEAGALAALRLAMRAELGQAQEPPERFVPRCVAWMAPRLGGDSPWRCWVAEGTGGLLGNLWLQRLEKLPNPGDEPELHAYVTSVYVVPAARGAGIGGRLLAAALEWCRAEAVDAVLLWPSARSRGLYERHGFGVRDDLFALRPASG